MMPYLAFLAMTQYYQVHEQPLFLLADYLYRPNHPFFVMVIEVHPSNHLHFVTGAMGGFNRKDCSSL